MTSPEFTLIYLKLAESNWSTTKAAHPHFQPINGHPNIMIGHENGSDIVALSPSKKPHSQWVKVSSAFESMVGGLPRFSGDWESTLMIKFRSDDREKILPFITDLFPTSSGDVDGHFDDVMTEWKSFFERWRAPLSPEEQRGLLGELVVLENLLENGQANLVKGWLGPSGSLHDFETEEWHIEVKTSLRANPTASIHPLSQLDPIDKPFDLVVVKIQRGEGMTLPEKVNQMVKHEKIKSSSSNLLHFQKMLEEIGYDDTDAHHYPSQYKEETECIRLDVNSATTLLQTNRIDSTVMVDDVRWRLLSSQHEFKECDSDYWSDPAHY